MDRPAQSDSLYAAPLLAVGLVSAAALAYEILLTRVFAIVHWHHLVATAISLALLGYGASGTILAILGQRLRRHLAPAFIGNALLFSVSSLICVGVAQRLPFDPLALTWEWRQLFYLASAFMILALPFFAAANCIGLALWQFKDEIPRLYGFDLIGAGLGAFLLLAGLAVLPPANLLFTVFAGGILASIAAARAMRWHTPAVVLTGLLLAGMTWSWAAPEIRPADYKDLARSMSVIGAQIDHQVSGIAGTVTVVRNDQVPLRQAPGLSLQSTALPPRQLAVFVDGDAVGALSAFRDHPAASDYLRDLTSALPYVLLDAPRVAVLNAGVGLEVQQALHLGASSVTAVEPNPLLYQLACARYLEFSPLACDRSRTDWHIQAPRAFLAGNSDPFDLISLSVSVDPAGLDALAANFGLTREAIQISLQHLAPGGLLLIDGPTMIPPRLSLRAIDTLRVALAQRGIQAPARHIAVIRGWQRFALLASNEPLEVAAQAAIRAFADARGFDLVWLPDMQPADANRYQQLSAAQYYLGAAAILAAPSEMPHPAGRFRLHAATDDTPFPNRFTRWQELWRALWRGERNELAQIDTGLFVGAATLMLVTAIAVVLILLPLAWIRQDSQSATSAGLRIRTLLYFGLVGIAFLCMEIAWIQRLQLFLGHPVYATTAVLASFLVFAGLGSLWSQKRFDTRSPRLLLPAALLAILLFSLAYIFFLTTWLSMLSGLPVAARIGIVLILTAPLAFAMGIPFPAGLRLLGERSTGLIPWAWGINGCTSVMSAAGAPLLAMEIGFNGLIMVAVAAYLGLLTVRIGR